MTVARFAQELGAPVGEISGIARQRGIFGLDAVLSDASQAAIRWEWEQEVSAKRLKAPTLRPQRVPRPREAPVRRSKSRRGTGGGYLNLALPLADKEAFRVVLCSRVLGVPRYNLIWDSDKRELEALNHRRPTREAMAAIEQDVAALRKAGEMVTVEQVADVEFGQSFSDALAAAARDLGVSPPTLRRLVKVSAKHGNSISWRLLRRLEAIFRERWPDVWRELELAALGTRGKRVLAEYDGYLRREMARYSAHRTEKHNLYLSRDERREREAFVTEVKKLGGPEKRAILGDLRVFDPLVGWGPLRRAMPPGQRLLVVRRGYRRDRELLRREMAVLHTELKKAASGEWKKERAKERAAAARRIASATPTPLPCFCGSCPACLSEIANVEKHRQPKPPPTQPRTTPHAKH